MDIIINSLYSKKEIFLRELISNGSDALDKTRFMSLTDPSVLGEGDTAKLEMKLIADKDAKTLTLIDRGCGMSKDDLINQLGTVAQSGTSSFIEAFSEGADVNLIGQFGVGFYSVYLVADSVAVHSKSNEDDKQWVWESTADSTFSVREKEADEDDLGRGTKIVLSLKEDCLEFLEEERLKGLIKRYSEFITFPIYLYTKSSRRRCPSRSGRRGGGGRGGRGGGGGGRLGGGGRRRGGGRGGRGEPRPRRSRRRSTTGSSSTTIWALWTRNPSDITDEEYKAFYKSLTKDFGEPLTWIHFKAEGEVEFKSILYIPKSGAVRPLQRLLQEAVQPEALRAAVMITDEFDDLVPRYLNFLRVLWIPTTCR